MYVIMYPLQPKVCNNLCSCVRQLLPILLVQVTQLGAPWQRHLEQLLLFSLNCEAHPEFIDCTCIGNQFFLSHPTLAA
jgi:hypothetical protein